MNFEEERFLLCKQSGKKSQVLPDSLKEGSSPPSLCEFRLDEKFLLDPQLICIGSKIGEGAHGKVYKGKYVYVLQGFMFCSAKFSSEGSVGIPYLKILVQTSEIFEFPYWETQKVLWKTNIMNLKSFSPLEVMHTHTKRVRISFRVLPLLLK